MDISTKGIEFLLESLRSKITKVIVYNGSTDVITQVFKKEIVGLDLKVYAYLDESYTGTYSNFRFAGDDGIVILQKEPGEIDTISKGNTAGYLKAFTVNITNTI